MCLLAGCGLKILKLYAYFIKTNMQHQHVLNTVLYIAHFNK